MLHVPFTYLADNVEVIVESQIPLQVSSSPEFPAAMVLFLRLSDDGTKRLSLTYSYKKKSQV